VGGRSRIYPFEKYQKIFPNIKEGDVAIVEGAGHWVHFDKPLETIQLIADFLKRVDS
jgi:pimeloyl-ACP methyl ester carboxylesterase